MKAKAIMSRKVRTATPDATLEEMLKVFINRRITGVPIVDSEGHMIGVFSEYDLIRQVAEAERLDGDILSRKIVFTPKVDAVVDTDSLKKIVGRFVKNRYRRLPVIDQDGKLVGIITRRDLMRVFFYQAKLPI